VSRNFYYVQYVLHEVLYHELFDTSFTNITDEEHDAIKNQRQGPIQSTQPHFFGGFGYGFAVVPGPNVTAEGRCFDPPVAGGGRGRGRWDTEYPGPWEPEG
jgi:hypothetical protein